MALLKAVCWALIFIIRIRFPPGTSLVIITPILICSQNRHNPSTVFHILIVVQFLLQFNDDLPPCLY
jgi:hypothetical protein